MEALIRQAELKDANLRNLLFDVRNRETQINLPIYYKHIRRDENSKADAYVNSALRLSSYCLLSSSLVE